MGPLLLSEEMLLSPCVIDFSVLTCVLRAGPWPWQPWAPGRPCRLSWVPLVAPGQQATSPCPCFPPAAPGPSPLSGFLLIFHSLGVPSCGSGSQGVSEALYFGTSSLWSWLAAGTCSMPSHIFWARGIWAIHRSLWEADGASLPSPKGPSTIL